MRGHSGVGLKFVRIADGPVILVWILTTASLGALGGLAL